jgi:hypothetical protein
MRSEVVRHRRTLSLLALVAGALLLALPASAQFRGGAMIPSVNGQGQLSVTAITYWSPGNEGSIGGSNGVVFLLFGSGQVGSAEPFSRTETPDPRGTRVVEQLSFGLEPLGLYTVMAVGCCWANGAWNIGSSGDEFWELSSSIVWDGETAYTPIDFDPSNVNPEVVRGQDYNGSLGAKPALGLALNHSRTLAIGITDVSFLGVNAANGSLFISAADTVGFPDNAQSSGADTAYSGEILAIDKSAVEFSGFFDAVEPQADDTPPTCDVAPDPNDPTLFLGTSTDDESGIESIAAAANATNLQVVPAPFEPGQLLVDFEVFPAVAGLSASGDVEVFDVAGNLCTVFVDIPVQDETPPTCSLIRDVENFALLHGSASDGESSIASITPATNARNLSVDTLGFEPGDPEASFEVSPADAGLPAAGKVVVRDGGDNLCQVFADIPVRHAAVPLPGWGEDAEIGFDSSGEATLLFVAMREAGVAIWDVSSLAEPFSIGTLLGESCSETDDEFFADDVELERRGDQLLVHVAAGRCGLVSFDVSNLTELNELGRFNTNGWAEDIAVENRVAHIADHNGGLVMVNLSDPENPSELAQVGRNNPEFGAAIDVELVDGAAGMLAYVATTAGLRIVDVTSPPLPQLVGQLDIDPSAEPAEIPQDVAVDGNTAYLALWQNRIAVVDVRRPFSPRETASIPLSAGAPAAYEVHVASQTLYVAEGDAGVSAYDLSPAGLGSLEPTPIEIAGGAGWAWDIASNGRDLFVSYGILDGESGGFQVLEYDPGPLNRACGLGFELALLAPLLAGLRRRPRPLRRG